jgi:ribonucleoside-diphosphate reductase alpha chain
VHPQVDAAVRAHAVNTDAWFRAIRSTGRLPKDAPPALRSILATAHEIAPEWHVKMQAAFQRFTDTSVSKTINLANDAPPASIASAYQLAFETGCKGVTVFRDGCKNRQVLRAGVQPDRCVECGEALVMQSGCQTCVSCGYSVCSV